MRCSRKHFARVDLLHVHRLEPIALSRRAQPSAQDIAVRYKLPYSLCPRRPTCTLERYRIDLVPERGHCTLEIADQALISLSYSVGGITNSCQCILIQSNVGILTHSQEIGCRVVPPFSLFQLVVHVLVIGVPGGAGTLDQVSGEPMW